MEVPTTKGHVHATIVANIGSGKSTLTGLLRKTWSSTTFPEHDLVIVDEPVDNWRNFDGKGANLLEAFYNDMKTNAGYMQMAVGESKIRAIERHYRGHDGSICITDTTILSDYEVFTRALRGTGRMDPIPFTIYHQQFERWMGSQPYLKPDAFVYLKTSPQTCRDRVLKRGRAEEIEKVTLEYLTLLNGYFEAWMATLPSESVLVLDGDQDFETNVNIANDFIQRMEHFVRGSIKD